jgi:hypothetical protein
MKSQSTLQIIPIQDLGNGTWYVNRNIEEKQTEPSPMMQSGAEKYYAADTVMVKALTVEAIADAIFRDRYPFLEEIALLNAFKQANSDEQNPEGIAYFECQAFRTESVALAKEVLSTATA